jgi:hypothetical protein
MSKPTEVNKGYHFSLFLCIVIYALIFMTLAYIAFNIIFFA